MTLDLTATHFTTSEPREYRHEHTFLRVVSAQEGIERCSQCRATRTATTNVGRLLVRDRLRRNLTALFGPEEAERRMLVAVS